MKRRVLYTAIATGVYLLWVTFVVGLKTEHLIIAGVSALAYLIHPFSRKIVLGFLFFLIYVVVYDSMRAFPNYEYGTVHIAEPYQFEKEWFGIRTEGDILTPNEYWEINGSTFLDVITGLFYLNWVPVPIAFGIYLFIKDKLSLVQFSLAFLLTNLIGFIFYYIYPAAPPWYYSLYGQVAHFNIPGNPAGLVKFDSFFGIHIFASLYAKNANVFAAIPSLHSSYPVVVLFYAMKKRLWFLSGLFLVFCAGIWFSAVYSGHHYIIDVLAGIGCAIASLLIFEKLILKTSIKTWVVNYAQNLK